MDSNANANANAAFERIIAIALRELDKDFLPSECILAFEEIIALARYRFDVVGRDKSS